MSPAAGKDHVSRDDLAAYTLGGLDEHEVAAVESHLEGCTKCQEDVRWLRPAIEILPEAVDQVEPPPELRKRLLDITRQDAELSGAAARRRKPVRERRLRFGRFVLAPAGALAAVAIAVAAIGGYSLGGGGNGSSTKTVAVTSVQPGSTASLELSSDSATLQAHHVPQLPPGAVYQVWVASPGHPPSASSVFRPSGDGSAAAAVPELLHGADQVMVTREPGRGSTSPSSAPIYSATIGR